VPSVPLRLAGSTGSSGPKRPSGPSHRTGPTAATVGAAPPTRIVQGGRAKAYRPLPLPERRAAIRAGLAAYRRGDYFLAHELLEPAWLGSPDLAERDLLSGLIKLAAAYVHAVRGNPTGVLKNLRGARERLRRGTAAAGAAIPIDVEALVAAVDLRIRGLEAAAARGRRPSRLALRAPRLRRLAPGTPR
jgi:hypothetical protein